jgi:BlaR1 peptidase M56
MNWSAQWLRTGDRSVERESLLATLIVLLGGLALQLFAAWPGRLGTHSAARQREQVLWLALWWPAAPALTVAAWLCGWALSQPDPVPKHVGGSLFVAVVPFVAVGVRALFRAAWSLCRSTRDCGIATVGLLWPRIVVAPELEKILDERAIHAAMAHERAHLRHRDPLRIWSAQFVTDLQWPRPSAQRRFTDWLVSLEEARDDEARAGGVEGADLAAAVLGSVRFQLGFRAASANLIGETEGLPGRIARLLRPIPATAQEREPRYLMVAGGVATAWVVAVVLGLSLGERFIDALLALSS